MGNSAIGGITSSTASQCFDAMVSPTSDLVLVEFSLNDRLVLCSQPAVMPVSSAKNTTQSNTTTVRVARGRHTQPCCLFQCVDQALHSLSAFVTCCHDPCCQPILHSASTTCAKCSSQCTVYLGCINVTRCGLQVIAATASRQYACVGLWCCSDSWCL